MIFSFSKIGGNTGAQNLPAFCSWRALENSRDDRSGKKFASREFLKPNSPAPSVRASSAERACVNCGAAAAAYAGLASILFHNHDTNSFRIALTYFSQDGLLAGRKVDEDRNFLRSVAGGKCSY